MYTMLAVCLVLHPQSIDESINAVLQDRKFAEKMARMQAGDLKVMGNFSVSKYKRSICPNLTCFVCFCLQEFENCFLFACPKFLSPVPPSLENGATPDPNQEPLYIQKTIFLQEVAQQIYLPTVRSFLKLYTTMPISKLAAFMETDETALGECLLCFKHKMHNVVWTKGISSLDGEFQAGSEVRFLYIFRSP